jgi:hypothetical protein
MSSTRFAWLPPARGTAVADEGQDEARAKSSRDDAISPSPAVSCPKSPTPALPSRGREADPRRAPRVWRRPLCMRPSTRDNGVYQELI